MRPSAGLAGILLAFGLSILASQVQAVAGKAAEPLHRQLDAIRGAFLRNDSSELSRQFLSDSKVYVFLPDFGANAFLGPGPLHALLDRVTHETQPTAFEFDRRGLADVDVSGPQISLKARWTYKDLGAQTTRSRELYFSLRAEDSAWRIAEIKAAR